MDTDGFSSVPIKALLPEVIARAGRVDHSGSVNNMLYFRAEKLQYVSQ